MYINLVEQVRVAQLCGSELDGLTVSQLEELERMQAEALRRCVCERERQRKTEKDREELERMQADPPPPLPFFFLSLSLFPGVV
jgi:hypothetical protein